MTNKKYSILKIFLYINFIYIKRCTSLILHVYIYIFDDKGHSFFFFDNPRYPGQLTSTTTKPQTQWTPCKPSRQVRHREDDRRARWDLNSEYRGRETLPRSLGHKPRCDKGHPWSAWMLTENMSSTRTILSMQWSHVAAYLFLGRNSSKKI